MRSILEQTISRDTVEVKSATSDIIYYEYTVKTTKLFTIPIFKKTTTYNCSDRDTQATDAIGFKPKTRKNEQVRTG